MSGSSGDAGFLERSWKGSNHMHAWPKRAQGLIAARGQLQALRTHTRGIITPQIIRWRKES